MAFGSLGQGVCASNKPAAFLGLVGSPESQFCQKASLGVVVLPAKSPFRRAVLPASTFSAGFLACKIAWNSRLSLVDFFLAAKARGLFARPARFASQGYRQVWRVKVRESARGKSAFLLALFARFCAIIIFRLGCIFRAWPAGFRASAPGRFSGWWLVPS